MRPLDRIDRELLNLLQQDCRMSLTDLSRHVGRSVDAVKKRLLKLQRQYYFSPKIQIRPRSLGFPYVVDVKVKLHNYDDKQIKAFIDYLTKHPRVAELFAISGEWNYTIVLIARDHEDLGMTSDEIRTRFHTIINGWSESLTTVAYKFEQYDLHALATWKPQQTAEQRQKEATQ